MRKIAMKELVKLAKNSESIRDQIVYRGFVDENSDPDIEYDYSEDTLVKISPLGKFVGSTPDGKPTVETIDEESVIQMAKQTEELLLDKDHASMRGPDDRNTEAYGWISGLKAIVGLGDIDGLYGLIKWTTKGIDLAKDRIYRFLSPVFELDENGRAIRLVNVALTNRPALPLPPIINSEGQDENNISITNSKKDTDNMSKEEIMTMIKDMIKETLAENSKATTTEVVNSEPKVEDVSKDAEEPKEEPKVEEPKEEPKVEETKDTEVKNEDVHIDIIEEKKDDVKVDETKNEEVSKDTEVEKEVIKADVLNSNPITSYDTVTGMEKWRSLKGADFFKYLREHPEVR